VHNQFWGLHRGGGEDRKRVEWPRKSTAVCWSVRGLAKALELVRKPERLERERQEPGAQETCLLKS
jgi:hypothetical protein